MTKPDQSTNSARLLHQRHPSVRPRFLQPVVAKQGSVFLLCTDTGDIQADSDQGLYFHDMRYLSAHTLRVAGAGLVSLLADAEEGSHILFELTNPDRNYPRTGYEWVGIA